MRRLLFATLAAAALTIHAGEDSTDKSGIGGTGPAFYDRPCGLLTFAGPVYAEDETLCKPGAGMQRGQAMFEQMGPFMAEHRKMIDEMSRMRDEHRAISGGTGAARTPSGGD